MKVIGLITHERYGVTEGKEYEVKFEYDTVYELELDDGGIGCRPKGFYEKKEEESQ